MFRLLHKIYLLTYKIKKRLINPRFYKYIILRILYPGVIDSKYKSNVSSMFMYSESIFYWFKDGAERLLYEHELDCASVVIDVGEYEANWTKKIYDRYQCKIYAYEPVKQHFDVLKKRVEDFNDIKIFNYGLGKIGETIGIKQQGIQTSTLVKVKKPDEIILIKKISELSDLKNKNIDLIHINIEGGEYELINEIIISSMIKRVKFLEVQFHEWYPTIKSSRIARAKLHRKLFLTHKLVYSYDFVWEKWKRLC